jgi:hypothetical protein
VNAGAGLRASTFFFGSATKKKVAKKKVLLKYI